MLTHINDDGLDTRGTTTWIRGSEVIEVFARPLIHVLVMHWDTIITRLNVHQFNAY